MPVDLIVAICGVFVTVAIVAASGTSWWLAARAPEQRRLRNLGPSEGLGLVVDDAPLTGERLDPTLARLSKLVPRSPKDMSRLQRRLAGAGYPHFRSAVYYALAEVTLPVAFGGIVLAVLGFSTGWPFALLAAALGYLLPGLFLRRAIERRQKAIQNGLPDALDLLTVCMEAGSGLDQAIIKTCDDLHIAHPILAEELQLIITEVRAGKPRLEAFKNFAQRTGVEDVRSLVSVLIQTDRFGTSIGQALRTHSDTSRTKRRQRAEERANKVGVKLVFPLALCLFPALYVVCFGPVVVAVYHAFFQGQ